MNGESWSPLYFDNAEFQTNILLGPGGLKQISGFNLERLGNAARAVAVEKGLLEHVNTQNRRHHDLCEFLPAMEICRNEMRVEVTATLMSCHKY